jgi:hypothetical protein
MQRCVLFVLLVAIGPLPSASPPLSHLEWAKKSQGRFAYGMYFRDKKVGWMIEEMKLGKLGGKEVVFSTTETYMETLFDDEKSVKHELSTICYALQGPGEIVSANTIKKEDGKELKRTVERVEKGLMITTLQGGRTIHRTVKMPRDTLAHHRELESWLSSHRKAGDRYTNYSVSWDEEEVNNKNEYLFQERKTILVDGNSRTVAVVKITLDGGKMDAMVLPDGRLLRAVLGGIITLKLEKEVEAKKLSGKPVDLMPITSVYIDKPLGRASNVERLKLELTGLGDFEVPASHRQIVKVEKNVVHVELRHDFRLEKGEALSDKEKADYRRTTPRLQCDQEQVKNLAKKIIGEETDTLKKARKIERWVFKNLVKSYSDNADTALEILDRKAGDCTEHALLFVALARAAGVSAREVGGLAYVPDMKPAFGWHAWAEIHDDHQWVSIDPTWGQVYVDGTHLKMSTGERDLAWTNVIGTLKMKVVEVKKK